MIARYDRDCRRTYVNPAFATMWEGNLEDFLGKTPSQFPGGAYAAAFEQNLIRVFSSGTEIEFEIEWLNQNQKDRCSLVRLTPEIEEDGQVGSVMAILRDITELQISRKKLYEMAFHDALTGLPNRALLYDRLHQVITDATWHHRKACVMMIDLDRFKSINDWIGHDSGDELLRETARRLSECVRSYDTVARLGGDEFVIVLPEVRGSRDLGRIAEKILRTIDRPYFLQGKEIFVTGSIGMAVFPGDGDTGKDLLKYADAAMYFAKGSGRNDFRFYSKDLTENVNRQLLIAAGLRHALERQEFELQFQPKVRFNDGRVIGSEALLRWRSQELGPVPPDQFIPIAEDTGLIVAIGQWVLREACRAAYEWNTADSKSHKVAVNVSGRQFQSGTLVETIATVLDETGCRSEWIELEITESLLLDEDGKIADMLTALRSTGMTIAIDDFGTGYSALSYLAKYSIDILKIDKSFVQAITNDRRRAELVKAILSIAECLGQKVVAEGVETPEQVEFLTKNNCQFAQGWYFSKALPKAEISTLLSGEAVLPVPSLTGMRRQG